MKMRVSKKLLSLLIAVIMLLSIAPLNGLGELFTTVAKAEELTEGFYTFIVQSGNATITKVDRKISGNIMIPDVLNGYPVTKIGDRAFEECGAIESIIVPQGVTHIGLKAFRRCNKLKNISFPKSLESIGDAPFDQCRLLKTITVAPGNLHYLVEDGALFDITKTTIISLPALYERTEYIVPNSVTTIGGSAFSECDNLKRIVLQEGVETIGNSAISECDSLTDVNIPNSVKTIETNAFFNCKKLTTINLSAGVETLGYLVFLGCTALESITVDAGNGEFSSKDGVLFDRHRETLIQYPQGKKGETYTVPNEVKNLGQSAFHRCNILETINLPTGLETIGSSVFDQCTSLTSIVLPKNITKIDSSTFRNCTSLRSVTIGKGVTYIYYWAFDGCTSLTDVYYLGSQEDWNNILIYEDNDGLENATIHCTTEIVDGDFTYTVFLGEATIKKAATTISGDLTVPSTINGYPVTKIGAWAFASCDNLTSVSIPDSITEIGNDAFWNCSDLTHATLPKGLTKINEGVFDSCVSMKSIIIHSNLREIGEMAFNNCQVLTNIYFIGDEADKNYTVGSYNWFFNNATVHYLKNLKLPESGAKTARYKNNVTVKITATGVPAGGFLVVDGNKFAPNEGIAIAEIKFQAASPKTFNAQITIGNGTVITAEEYKVNVDTGFFAKLSAFFMDFLFNGFKWKSATIEF